VLPERRILDRRDRLHLDQELLFHQPVDHQSIVKYFQPPVWIGILQTEWLF
jgi:hypothetical protein